MKEKYKRYLEMKPIKPDSRKYENIWKYKELRKKIIKMIIIGLIIGIIIVLIILIPISNIMKEKETSVPIYQQYEKITGAQSIVYKNDDLNVTIRQFYDSYIDDWWYKAYLDTISGDIGWDGAEFPEDLYTKILNYYQDDMTSDQIKWFDYMLHNVVE